MDTVLDFINKHKLIACLIVTLILVAVNNKSPILTLGLVAGVILFVHIYKSPIFGISLFIVSVPFTGLEILDTQIMGIPGLKPINILAGVILMCFIITKKSYPIKFVEKAFIITMVSIFFISIIRVIPYIDELNEFWNETLNVVRLFQSHFVRPILYFIPIIIIVLYVRSKKDISFILNALNSSLFVLSLYLVIFYLFFVPDRTNFENVREAFGISLSMHGNDIADFYIIGIPILFAQLFHKRNFFLVVTFVLSILSLGILYSRTAYFVFLFSIVLFFIISGRKRFIPIIAMIILLGIMIIPSSVKDRALTGLTDRADLNTITAGRTEDIWYPLINEYLNNPRKLIIGDGRYSIIHSDAFREGLILPAGNAHNMYLEFTLDCGLLGLAIMIAFIIAFTKRYISIHKEIKYKYYRDLIFGIETSLIAHLMSGLTGRAFFPVAPNSYIWVVLGLGLAISYNYNNSRSLKTKVRTITAKRYRLARGSIQI